MVEVGDNTATAANKTNVILEEATRRIVCAEPEMLNTSSWPSSSASDVAAAWWCSG
jgi:hypothetical protein